MFVHNCREMWLFVTDRCNAPPPTKTDQEVQNICDSATPIGIGGRTNPVRVDSGISMKVYIASAQPA